MKKANIQKSAILNYAKHIRENKGMDEFLAYANSLNNIIRYDGHCAKCGAKMPSVEGTCLSCGKPVKFDNHFPTEDMKTDMNDIYKEMLNVKSLLTKGATIEAIQRIDFAIGGMSKYMK